MVKIMENSINPWMIWGEKTPILVFPPTSRAAVFSLTWPARGRWLNGESQGGIWNPERQLLLFEIPKYT